MSAILFVVYLRIRSFSKFRIWEFRTWSGRLTLGSRGCFRARPSMMWSSRHSFFNRGLSLQPFIFPHHRKYFFQWVLFSNFWLRNWQHGSHKGVSSLLPVNFTISCKIYMAVRKKLDSGITAWGKEYWSSGKQLEGNIASAIGWIKIPNIYFQNKTIKLGGYREYFSRFHVKYLCGHPRNLKCSTNWIDNSIKEWKHVINATYSSFLLKYTLLWVQRYFHGCPQK